MLINIPVMPEIGDRYRSPARCSSGDRMDTRARILPCRGAPQQDRTSPMWTLTKQAVFSWLDDYAPIMGAALAY